MGLNTALNVARNALDIFSTGIEIAGNNVANANTPGYIREELELETSPDQRRGSLILGTGVLTGGVRQQVDLFLQGRVYDATTAAANASTLDGIYKRLEAELNELGNADLSTSLNDFLAAINDVVNQPESIAVREVAVQRGEQFARDIQYLRTRVDELRRQESANVDALVSEANTLMQQVADLNVRISKIEAAGHFESDAGALRSQRYTALERLAEILPVSFTEQTNGAVNVFSGNDYLVIGDDFQQLTTTNTVDRGVIVQTVRLSKTGADVSTSGGELGATATGRDTVLGGFVDDLDSFARNVVLEFNKLHASGQGLTGFTTMTAANAVADTAADLDATAANLPFTPVHGGFRVRITNSASGQTTTTDVTVDLDGIGNDDGLADLRTKLDAIANLTATVSTDGRLSLTTAAGYEVTFADDTSNVLAALGLNTFFTGRDSSDIAINSVVSSDTRHLAAALGGGPSDGTNAIRLAEFHETVLTDLNGVSIDGHYRNTVTGITQNSASQGTINEGREAFRTSLDAQRQQFNGVSIDEEAIKILELQRSYQAAARVISTVDELFETLINL